MATRWVWLATGPNTTELAGRWIEQHVDRERDTIAASFALRLPLARDPAGWATVPRYARSPVHRYLHDHPDLGAPYAIRTLLTRRPAPHEP